MVNYWIWVAKKDGINGNILPDEIWTWNGCDIETSVGDKVLIYKTKPDKHIRYLVEVTKDSWLKTDELPDEIFSCEFKAIYDFENPLSIDDMREEENLVDWYPLKVSFVKMKFPIDDHYWNILKDVLTKNNLESKDYF